ncbi:cytochrome P450 [Coemansia reversa NRRL 1564]|uniref:Cytochrome P450 n=1 Tax=Coemansia reversa (strain ATCC 12441 / NRRL 1564) TaxID=763665 RepID=A0A2G5BHN4_COERN|nr:cytochrome P450 [Coemansia reversa NRRL 1564]|eukprot:PIA18530.1 cytochrome P450 [Coemansia reversa NRRL 1564]
MDLTAVLFSPTLHSVLKNLTLFFLVGSICFYLYKTFIANPLGHIPGPWYTKVTGIVRKYHAWRHSEHHYYMKLFERYGPIVRVGPNRVGVGEIEMFRKLMSTYDMPKSQMYSDFAVVGENIFTTRRQEFNKARRRQVGPAFSLGYVRRMEPMIMTEGVDRICRLFDTQLRVACSVKENKGIQQQQPQDQQKVLCNIHNAFSTMTTDLISSLAFGKRFGALDMLIEEEESKLRADKEQHDWRLSAEEKGHANKQQLEDNTHLVDEESAQTIMQYSLGTMMLMVLTAEIPFIGRIPKWILPANIKNLSNLRDNFMQMTCNWVSYYRMQMTKQMNSSDSSQQRIDIVSAFIKAHDPETGAMMSDREIASEGTVLLVAGSDTSSNTMVNCIRLLIKHPETYHKVCNEIRSQFPGGSSTITYTEAVAKLPYLNAVIYETMRLRASTSGAWPRDTPEEGITLGDWFIPSGNVICGSIGGVHLNPDTWWMPKRFMPERFLGPEGEIRRKNVVVFSAGVRMCPGRHLAMMELVMTLATVLCRYDFALPTPVSQFSQTGNEDNENYFTEVEEICHITTAFRYPERDCNFYLSHSGYT